MVLKKWGREYELYILCIRDVSTAKDPGKMTTEHYDREYVWYRSTNSLFPEIIISANLEKKLNSYFTYWVDNMLLQEVIWAEKSKFG